MNKFWLSILCITLSVLLSACSGNSTQNNTSQSSLQIGGAMQGAPLSLSQTVSTLAGMAPGSTDGTGTAARFNQIYAITSDGTNLYVADNLDNTIRKVVIATGTVTTLAGKAGESGATDAAGAAARFYSPRGLTTDGTNLYVADTSNHAIRKVEIATGIVTTLAGCSGTSGYTDGAGAAARFRYPKGITTDGTNLFVVDNTSTIRKIEIATGTVTTLAVAAENGGSADGAGPTAGFGFLVGIATDGTNLFVADSRNNTIRKIVIATGEMTTLAGTTGTSGTTDATGAAARFRGPQGITTDGTNLFVTDSFNNTIRKVEIATGTVTTLAGSGQSGAEDGTGATASFSNPFGITTDGTDLFVTDFGNCNIRKVKIATGVVTTLAGAGSRGAADGAGSSARFFGPRGITTDGTNLFVADSTNSTIRKVVIATGVVSTLAGSVGNVGSADGTGSAAQFSIPGGITTDGTNLFVADSGNNIIRKVVIATGEVTTLAGSAGAPGATDATGSAARFHYPQGITTDGTNLFVTDFFNHTIRKVAVATNEATTLAGSAGTPGSADGAATEARFNYPQGITTDGSYLFVVDSGNGKIRKIAIKTGEVTTMAEISAASPVTTSRSITFTGYTTASTIPTPIPTPIPTATPTSIPTPTPITITTPASPPPPTTTSATAIPAPSACITTDGTNLYMADMTGRRVLKMVIATGAVTTIAGTGAIGSDDGPGTAAKFYRLYGITTDGKSLFVTEFNNTIRRID